MRLAADSLWHAFRRGWATARKYLSDVDVAAAGGWKETTSLKQAYQQADQDTMLEVVMGAGKLRERQANIPRNIPNRHLGASGDGA